MKSENDNFFNFFFTFRYSSEFLCSTLPNESSSSIDTTDSRHDEDVNSSSNKSTALPYPFVVKDSMIRNSVLVKLEKKMNLTESDRKCICMGIYDECTKYT